MIDDLCKPAFDGEVRELQRLLDARTNVWSPGDLSIVLHVAIENQQASCVRLLIDRGADIEDHGSWNLSPLAHAIDIACDGNAQSGGKAGDEPADIVTMLLEAGAKPSSGFQIAQDYRSAKLTRLLTTFINE
jgi:hypothetical protein